MQLNQAIDWLQGPRAEQAARLVALLLGVWLLYRIAVLVWALVPAPELPQPPVSEPVTAVPGAGVQPGKPRLDVAQVTGWHLFGAGAQTETTGGPAPIDAPETRLNLVLRGVLSSDDPEEARAIIAEPNGTENHFRVGSALPGGAELKEIHGDRIILLRAGRHETLRLPREAMDGAVNKAPAAPGALPGGPGADAGALLGEYREQAAENPQALLDLARPVPYNDTNGFAGFRLFPGNKPALFAQLGLQPGDLVKEVNGIVLDNPARAADIMQQLRESGQVALRIQRGGQDINLAVDIP
mgnify:CR=1 FL=1